MSEVINGFMGVSMEKIRSMVDANTMMGSPINCADGTTVIPVSKVSLGFASGGSDLPTRTSKEYFAGGAGAGITVKPQGFLVIKDGDVRLVQLSMDADKGNVMLNMIPEVVDKITALIPKKKKKGEEEAPAEEETETSEE
ncbi:MAG: sporulation protein YtfJ [Oscillospiraceae bacterium]|nr:sporulation protein YtfJ [Oscillospiraceae bacterium]